MRENPKAGGSYIRDPKTGKISPAKKPKPKQPKATEALKDDNA